LVILNDPVFRFSFEVWQNQTQLALGQVLKSFEPFDTFAFGAPWFPGTSFAYICFNLLTIVFTTQEKSFFLAL
jgi:hypothetical protein